MSEFAREISSISVETELKNSYLEYAMSVLVGRALPDARDGLKPVHRRILYAMHELGNDYNKAYKKSARIVGDVIAKYHPHGDSAIYDSLVRMAQTFSLRYVLVDGQGNFGSIDGDAAAAMRYTEVRMAKVAHSLLADLEKETVNFVPNYDGNEQEPQVLPTRIPNLLINGSAGIAVGMATNIPPHNLGEVITACIALIDNPNLSFEEILSIVPGPDFPTAGLINGRAGILEAYRTGRGRIQIRAKIHVEEDENNGKASIIVTELPYQVNKARLIERIAELVKEKILDGITALRDESDREGMRIVIELRRGENTEVMINQLYIQTQLQVVYGINMVALLDGQPMTLNLRQLLDAFLRHRREIVTRRSIFELRKARERAHILEGLAVALANINEMISIIKSSQTGQEAKEKLLSTSWQSDFVQQLLSSAGEDVLHTRPEDLPVHLGLQKTGYFLSPTQAQAILDMRLQRLTGLEQEKIVNEYKELLMAISDLREILTNPERLMHIIKEELVEVKNNFSDERRTVILDSVDDISMEDLIPQEDRVITLSHEGYIKTQPVSAYQAQRRGGKGKSAAVAKEEDFIDHLWVANTHDMLLCFSSIGKVYWLKVYQLPEASRMARGRPIINLLSLQENEKITAVLPIKEFNDQHFVFMATSHGVVKKVSLAEFSRPRNNGIIAIDLVEDEVLIGVDLTHGNSDIMLFSDAGKVIRFPETKVRCMGRTARGVRGISLQTDQKLISLVVVQGDGDILTATERGFGKRTPLEDYRLTGRGGQGVISIQVSERNGKVVAAQEVMEMDEVFLISDQGTMVRTRISEISCVGRNTQGVRLINLAEGEKLSSLEKIAESSILDLDKLEDSKDSSVEA